MLMLTASCSKEVSENKIEEREILPVEHVTLAELNAIYIENGIDPLPDNYIEIRKEAIKTRATSQECYAASTLGDVNNSGTVTVGDLVSMAYRREEWDTAPLFDDILTLAEIEMIFPQDLQDRVLDFAYISTPHNFIYTIDDSNAVQDYLLNICND